MAYVCPELAKCVLTHCVSSFSLVSPGLQASPRRALSFGLNCVSLVIEYVLEWPVCVLKRMHLCQIIRSSLLV